jgi:hypothetical protein
MDARRRKYLMMMLGKSKLRIASQDVRDKILFGVPLRAAHFIFRASKILKRLLAPEPLVRFGYDILRFAKDDSLRGEQF